MLDEMGQKMFLELVKIESSLKLAAGIFLIVLVAGCTYGNKVAYDSVKRTKKSPDQIQVFEARDVKRAYRVIGLVSSDSYYMHSALKAIRKEAGELGADAIIDFGPNGTVGGFDAFRLSSFANSLPSSHDRTVTENDFQKCLARLQERGIVIAPRLDPSPHLLYFASDFGESEDADV